MRIRECELVIGRAGASVAILTVVMSSPEAYHTNSLDVVFLGNDRVDLVYGGTTAGRASAQTFQLTRKAKS